jgi:hypothetical protein
MRKKLAAVSCAAVAAGLSASAAFAGEVIGAAGHAGRCVLRLERTHKRTRARQLDRSAVQATKRSEGMAKLVAVLAAAVVGLALTAGSASATIHPIMVGWVCGQASGDPPGQTPGETHSAQSTFRALQATGVVIGVDPTTGLPIFDFDNPAMKFSSFTVVPEETGTPSNPGAINCAKGILATTT